MSYYNQQQAPVGVPPPQGYPRKDADPPQGYPPQEGYAPQYPQQPPPMKESADCLQTWLAALCCAWLFDACY